VELSTRLGRVYRNLISRDTGVDDRAVRYRIFGCAIEAILGLEDKATGNN
jgi:hypothetical protein